MPVAVASPSILKRWREGTGSMVGVRSKAPVEALLTVVGDAIERQNAINSDDWTLGGPWPTPDGRFHGGM